MPLVNPLPLSAGPMAEAIRKAFAENPRENDPRVYMGAAKSAVKEMVINKIKVSDSNGFVDRCGA